MKIDVRKLKANPNIDFAIIQEPVEHKQHPNQKGGLDLYISVLNISTGEVCFKKLYKNTKGLHFKHTGYSPMYLKEFTREVHYVPYQVIIE